MKIQKIHARQILDSRGNPTVEVELTTKKGMSKAIVPSGASTGSFEALELRDNAKAYNGKSVTKAVRNINRIIAPMLKGEDVLNQEHIDVLMIRRDATPNKKRLGANAILAVSMATLRAAANAKNQPLYKYIAKKTNSKPILPIPFANVINGGVHAGNQLEFQEFMIVPVGANSFTQATQMIVETYQEIKKILQKKYSTNATNVGDEGGFAPPIKKAEEALDIITEAIKNTPYKNKIKIATDVASSEYFNKNNQRYFSKKYSAKSLSKYYSKLIKKYDLVSIEDPFDQNDFDAWKIFTENNKTTNPKLQIVGDDLTVSNPARVQFAIDQKHCNSLLLKINQIGTITEALLAAKIAKKAGWKVMVSHRSGETEDTFIADLAAGLGCGQIKLGAPCRTDRTAKYNQLLRIEEDLGRTAKFGKY